MTAFDELKEICRQACHERNACKPGFEALMQTESVAGILQVWRDNWQDVYESKFSDVMAQHIVRVFGGMKDEFHRNGFYVNEPTEQGMLIVSRPQESITVGGAARCYLFSAASITATDNAQVYCRDAAANVMLSGHAYGRFEAGNVTVREFAEAHGRMTVCHTYDAAEVVCESGVVVDHGHRRIAAYLGTKVYSDTPRNIEVSGQARIWPLADFTENKGTPDTINNETETQTES